MTYDGRPHLIQFGEAPGGSGCSHTFLGRATYAYPRIYDIADERSPKLVADVLLESALPANCREVAGDAPLSLSFGYSVHHCIPDRIYQPTIMACSWFAGGLRIIDIRDPRRPRELAYFNPGSQVGIGTGTRVVLRSDRRQVWVGNQTQGFYVMGFAPGV